MRNSTPFLRDTAVAIRYDISRSTIWRWVKEDRFPKPIKLGPASTRWRIADLEAWDLIQASKGRA
jgi:prophage regulatory protein